MINIFFKKRFKIKRKNFLCLLLIAILNEYFLQTAKAATFLPHEINGNLTLNIENSPFLSNEDVIVNKKAKLTIDPGCELRFAKGKQLIVYGTLEARGTELNRIIFTKLSDTNSINETNNKISKFDKKFLLNNNFRLVEGETILDGKLQIYYNAKWHYVCSTQFNWTEIDVNVTCKSLGFSNGTFYYYAPSNNLTSHMKVFMPRCTGKENNLFECTGTVDPELGLTVCDHQNVVGLVCEGFNNEAVNDVDNWGGIVFHKYAPYLKTQQFISVFYNQSQSILEYVDIRYAGLIDNHNRYKPKYSYMPSSAITVFQYAPRFNHLTIENSIANGLNYSNIEAPALITNSIFRYNRGHGIVAKTRFGNVSLVNTQSYNNMGDGLKYHFNNTVWSLQEQEEYFVSRYVEFCDSQNPLSYPAYYRFRNPNYVRECSKTFSTESNLRITLHFQKVNIRSKFSTYWLEVYDGQTDKNSLIANYTFENGKTPESIYSRTNYMYVKLKFHCNYPSDRKLQPIELKNLNIRHSWDQMKENQFLYEQKLYKYNPPNAPHLQADRPWQENPFRHMAPFSLNQMSIEDQQKQLYLFEKQEFEKNSKFKNSLGQKEHVLQQSRIFCPYSGYDDITMYAMIGNMKHPDLTVKNSFFINNSFSGINATGLHSLVQLNESTLKNNHMNGLHVQGGAGDISLYHCKIESNSMNGINITYAGGLKEFNYTEIYNNGLYGIYTNYDVHQEFDNIFQNTTINGSVIESNILGGAFLGSYCNNSNITINSTIFRNNQENGLTIESCRSNDGVDWYTLDQLDYNKVNYKRYLNLTVKYAHVNISWNLFQANRLNALKIVAIQNMIGLITNNTISDHTKGGLLITPNNSKTGDTIIRNVSMQIMYNTFRNNSGRYALNVGLNQLADKQAQSINITFNRFEYNTIRDPYSENLNSRSSVSAVAIVSSSNVAINQNWFNNPNTKLQIATQLDNYTGIINASYNWFHTLQPVYDLNYFSSNRDKCNQQWITVRQHIFDHSNRSNLAQIVYWPFACNDRLWYHQSSIDLPPPGDFDMSSTDSLGGIYDFGDSILPVNRYTVTNDIVIKPGAKLTIKSGTELNFLNGIGMLVLGELVVEGVIASPVRFKLLNRQSINFNIVRSHVISNQNYEAEAPASMTTITTSATFSSSLITIFTNSTTIANSKMLNFSLNDQKEVFNEPSSFRSSFTVDLVDGTTAYEGRLRVDINGQSGTVCNRGWNIINSKIVCQQLGLILDPNMYLYTRWLPNDHRNNEPILMSEVQCDSLDTNIFQCRHTNRNDHTCTHQDDVWIRCLKPGWAGIRIGMSAQSSRIKFATFEEAGQYDYAEAHLAPALQIDLLQHEISNITFEKNHYVGLEIMFNQPFKKSTLYNLDFISNLASGLVTRTSFLHIQQLFARNHHLHPAIEYNPYFSQKTLESIRLFSAQPNRGQDVRRELTRLPNNIWYIGNEQQVLLYTDTEYNFGPQELNIQIKTDNNRVLVVDLIDYNTNFDEEKVIFCEKFCQQSFADPLSREWNLTVPSNSIYFPINTSYSVLHISYNVSTIKSGRLTFLVYSVKAPEPVFDYSNPSYVYIRNIMPDNRILINNSTFYNNRHSIVLRHYDDTVDIHGNLRKRYNYTNIIISNCTFDFNDQIFWVNTDPVLPTIHQRSNNLTIHIMHNFVESNKDDILVSESGYDMYDLVPNVKNGPIGRINVTFEECIIKNNFGGIRSIYRYHEYSNTLWHYEIRNNRFLNNKKSVLKLYLPRIHRFAIKNDWENISHSLNIRNNEFSGNTLFEMMIDGYYSQINMTKNLFIDNKCRIGLVKLTGTQKDFYIYSNHIERNEGHYIFDLEANSQADNDYDYPSLFVDNILQQNRKTDTPIWRQERQQKYNEYESSFRDAAFLFVQNSPSFFTVALRGVQNCSFHRNIFENEMFDYEFIGAMTTNTINSTIDATLNWWGTEIANQVKERIFDIHEWNNHAFVNFVPYYSNKIDYSLSRAIPELSVNQNLNEFILGGLIYRDLSLTKKAAPYQIRADLTIMPGATLYIGPGVEMEFYPNVGILVLGDLKASGTQESLITMRPVKKTKNRMSYYSSNSLADLNSFTNEFDQEQHYINYQFHDSSYLNSSKRFRFFAGLTPNEGFLQIYNATLRSWTMICDEQFTLASASIVCKQMGKEYRNPLVKSLFYYMAPELKQPIWNQTFICLGGEQTLGECHTYANHHIEQCRIRGEYIYVSCNNYNLDNQGYEHSWGGIRFAQPYFEQYSSSIQNQFGLPETPIYLKPDLQQQQSDSSFMYFVNIVGAGRLHNEQSPSVQLIQRTPLISFCNILDSTYHGLDFIQSKSTVVFNKIKINSSLGYGLNSLQLNVQTTDQKSSFNILDKNTLSNQNIFSMIDLCDPHKYYNLDQRVIVYFKYSNLAKDCVKIFRTRMSSTNLGTTGQIGLRFLQVMLVNNTIQNDTIEIYNGTLFNEKYLMASLTNGTHIDMFDRFYLSKTDSLSIFMKASMGREYFGFIAEVLVYPTAQYLLTDTYIELSDSELTNNQLGALSYISAGERNPNFYIIRNRFINNGFEYFNWTTLPTVDLLVQNTPKFYFGNNYVANNWGGVTISLYSGSGVLITSSIVFNNYFYANRNDTILCTKGGMQLPYNELTIDKNVFIENDSPRTDLVIVSGLISKFTRNQLVYNKAARILFTQGFENVSTPRYQDITFNLLRDNYAYGIINDLEDPNRFRSTMVAASLKQVYYSNYLFNKDNDFELTALVDPLSIAFLHNYYSSTTPPPYFWNELYDKDFINNGGYDKTFDEKSNYFKSIYDNSGQDQSLLDKSAYASFNPDLPVNLDFNPIQKSKFPNDLSNYPSMVAYTGVINATYNYWSTNVDSEIRARIRDKYDNVTLFEIAYSPAVPDEFKLRDGKCELGWSLIDDTCYTYIGSYVTYKEAENACKKFESRLARETVAPIKLPRFRKLARTSQFDYEAQSYRRIWLYTDFIIGSDMSKCSVIEDYGEAFSKCDDFLPFICEKDPVFLGAAFRFKDEIAFAIAAIGALIVCILLLSILWLCKSRNRKKEHIDRQNTLRSSARTHRHMINNSAFSTLSNINQIKSSSSALYGLTGNSSSIDNLSTNKSVFGSRSTGGIYNSQRNQYFANKKHKNNKNSNNSSQQNSDDLKSNNETLDNQAWETPRFTGLDNNEGANYYGGKDTSSLNEENEIKDARHKNDIASVQYHIYDPTNENKSSNNQYEYEEDDEEDDTTTDELTDDTIATKQNTNRSPANLSTKTTADEQFNENFNTEKQFIHTKLVKQLPTPLFTNKPNTIPPQSSYIVNEKTKLNEQKPHKFMSSYDQLMNTTITDNEDDPNEANSRRLLTNKINTSNFNENNYRRSFFGQQSKQSPLQQIPKNNYLDNQNNVSTFTTASILSKSTTNMTSVTPLANNSIVNNNNNTSETNIPSVNPNCPISNNLEAISSKSTSDYENLSNATINEIEVNYSNQKPNANQNIPSNSNRNIFIQNGVNLIQTTSLHPTPPIVAQPPAPPVQLSQFKRVMPQELPKQQFGRRSMISTVPPKISSYPYDGKIVPSSTEEEDAESVMSCQLITSASLLLNRGEPFQLREAKRIVDNRNLNNNNPNLIATSTRKNLPLIQQSLINQTNANNMVPPLNPRHFLQPSSSQVITQNDECTQTQIHQDDIVQNINLDPSKPPPMETAI